MRGHPSLRRTLASTSLVLCGLASGSASADEPWPERPALDETQPVHSDCEADVEPISIDMTPFIASYHEARALRLDALKDEVRDGALSGLHLAVSPGHGLLWDDGIWRYQRDITNDVREDVHTNQMAIDWFYPMLERAGADVLPLRESTYTAAVTRVVEPSLSSSNWQPRSLPGWDDTFSSASGGDEAPSARWEFVAPTTGILPVYARVLHDGPNTARARYVINYAGDVANVEIRQDRLAVEDFPTAYYPNTPPRAADERVTNVRWEYLGRFPFVEGNRYSVTASAGDDGALVAGELRVGGGEGIVDVGFGTTEELRWYESAIVFLRWMGQPGWAQVNDPVVRPLYAVERGVDMYIAFHTNCCESSGTSTYVWYPEMWVQSSSWPAGWADENLPEGTLQAATLMQDSVVEHIRASWDPEWRDRGVLGANFGELRPLIEGWRQDNRDFIDDGVDIEAALFELAFHDTAYDARLLREHGFRHELMRGVFTGLVRYHAGEGAAIPPRPITAFSARGDTTGVQLSWEAPRDDVVANTEAASYRVYRSDDGVSFQRIGEVETPRFRDNGGGCAGGFYRVTAVNEGGESLDSPTLYAYAGDAMGPAITLVDGVDRTVISVFDPPGHREPLFDSVQLVRERWPDARVSSSTDDATPGLGLEDEDLVIWALGESGDRVEPITAQERAVFESMASTDTRLILSGSEYAWHAASRDGAIDTAWLTNVLGVTYVSDDSDSTRMSVGDLTVSFGTCERDSYCVEFPEVLDAPEGSEVVATYPGGTGAGVRSNNGRWLIMGVPLEAVIDTDRPTVMSWAADQVDGDWGDGICDVEPVGDAGTDTGFDAGGSDGGTDTGAPDTGPPDAAGADTGAPDVSAPDASTGEDDVHTDGGISADTSARAREVASRAAGGCAATGRSGGGALVLLFGLFGIRRRRG